MLVLSLFESNLLKDLESRLINNYRLTSGSIDVCKYKITKELTEEYSINHFKQNILQK